MPNEPTSIDRLAFDSLVAERRALRTGYAAAARSVLGLPLVAALGFAAITVPRSFFDVDPLLGSPGYLLCPTVCQDCTGPWRVVTHSTRRANRDIRGAPQYFCPSPTNGIASLSDNQLKDRRASYARYELVAAPAASSWLAIVLLFLPAAVLHAWHAASSAKGKAAEIDAELFAAAKQLGLAVPEPPRPPGFAVLVRAALLVAATIAGAVAVIALELAYWRFLAS